MSIKLVIFDMDDTLLTYESAYKGLDLAIYKNFQNEIFATASLSAFKKAYNRTEKIYYSTEFETNYNYTSAKIVFWEMVLQDLDIDYKASDLQTLYTQSLQILNQRREIIPGSIDFLEYLGEKNIKRVVLSKGFSEWKYEALKCKDILKYFERVYGTVDYKLKKENGSAFSYVLEQMQISPEETIAIGDVFEIDIKPPRDIGCKAIQVDFTAKTKNENTFDSYAAVQEAVINI
jgi:putative hydrolase of the HAD superfamily